MRRKKHENTIQRMFEKGFLSADCGEMAPEDINYYQLYKPDIEHRDDVPCDYVLNETVLLYSHENTRNYGMMISDYLNVWTTLWLSGLSKYSKDISFLNIDGFLHRKIPATSTSVVSTKPQGNDQINHFFRLYDNSFRRIIKGSDFLTSSVSPLPGSLPRVCVKRLLLPSKPLLSYHWDVTEMHDPSVYYDCPKILVSSLFQRWNLHIRNSYSLLSSSSDFITNQKLQVLLLTRSIHSIPSTSSSHYLSRIISNQNEIITSLKQLFLSSASSVVEITLEVVDLVSLSYDEQVRLIGKSGMIVGMTGSGIASSIHMPIGTRYCCGVIEIFPENLRSQTSSETKEKVGVIRSGGFSQLARRLGHTYHRLDLPSGSRNASSQQGTIVPLPVLKESVKNMVQQILQSKGSCILPEVLKAPYF
jgi:hypothetical protein